MRSIINLAWLTVCFYNFTVTQLPSVKDHTVRLRFTKEHADAYNLVVSMVFRNFITSDCAFKGLGSML